MLQFRPHHFMCALGFQGKGYSPEFVAHFHGIADQLKKDEIQIQVVTGTDTICEVCPNLEGNQCNTEQKTRQLDQAHAGILGVETGQVLTWKAAKTLITENMTPVAFDAACGPCSWKSLGVCRSALVELRQ